MTADWQKNRQERTTCYVCNQTVGVIVEPRDDGVLRATVAPHEVELCTGSKTRAQSWRQGWRQSKCPVCNVMVDVVITAEGEPFRAEHEAATRVMPDRASGDPHFWVVTVNRVTGEATSQLWNDKDAAWQRSIDISAEDPELFATVVTRLTTSR